MNSSQCGQEEEGVRSTMLYMRQTVRDQFFLLTFYGRCVLHTYIWTKCSCMKNVSYIFSFAAAVAVLHAYCCWCMCCCCSATTFAVAKQKCKKMRTDIEHIHVYIFYYTLRFAFRMCLTNRKKKTKKPEGWSKKNPNSQNVYLPHEQNILCT